MGRPMQGPERAAELPRSVKELVLGYLNTCQVMGKLWFWVMAFLAVGLPLAFYGAGNTQIEALINGGGFWLITGILSRLAVFEFRQLRAGWVARKIGRRVRTGRTGTPSSRTASAPSAGTTRTPPGPRGASCGSGFPCTS